MCVTIKPGWVEVCWEGGVKVDIDPGLKDMVVSVHAYVCMCF